MLLWLSWITVIIIPQVSLSYSSAIPDLLSHFLVQRSVTHIKPSIYDDTAVSPYCYYRKLTELWQKYVKKLIKQEIVRRPVETHFITSYPTMMIWWWSCCSWCICLIFYKENLHQWQTAILFLLLTVSCLAHAIFGKYYF